MASIPRRFGLGLAVFALVAVAAIPAGLTAADHLDAPGLTSPGGDGRLDVNDLYLFTDGGYAAMIMTVNPLTTPVEGNPGFHPGAQYQFVVDQNENAKTDSTYRVEFGPQQADGSQWLKLRKTPARGQSAVIAEGWTGTDIPVVGGGVIRADQFDDPFYFDLVGFLTSSFCDGDQFDALAGTNVSGIVLKLPSWTVTGTDSTGGVWARTMLGGSQIDRMGRPAINTVFIPTGVKNTYNSTKPWKDAQKFSQYLEPFGLEGALLPDILTIDTSVASGFLNGRLPADDVIDIELGILGIVGDCVDANDVAFPVGFPYLAPKHLP